MADVVRSAKLASTVISTPFRGGVAVRGGKQLVPQRRSPVAAAMVGVGIVLCVVLGVAIEPAVIGWSLGGLMAIVCGGLAFATMAAAPALRLEIDPARRTCTIQQSGRATAELADIRGARVRVLARENYHDVFDVVLDLDGGRELWVDQISEQATAVALAGELAATLQVPFESRIDRAG